MPTRPLSVQPRTVPPALPLHHVRGSRSSSHAPLAAPAAGTGEKTSAVGGHLPDIAAGSVATSAEPATVKEALASPDSEEWRQAILDEFAAMQANDVYDVVPRADLPKGHKLLRSMVIFRRKRDDQGKVIKYKARWVAKGYSQVHGVNYTDTFAPTATIAAIRTMLAMAVARGMDIQQMDVNTAFLNAPVDHEIYVQPPAVDGIFSPNTGTLSYTIKYAATGDTSSGSTADGVLSAYSDASFASDVDTRRSRTGFVVFCSTGPVSWNSKLQATVATASADADAVLCEPTLVHTDNQPAQRVAEYAASRMRHILVKYHYIRECVDTKRIVLSYLATEHMIADFLTKILPRPKTTQFCTMLFDQRPLPGCQPRARPHSGRSPRPSTPRQDL
ncbi:hypothetical protein PTSG_12309 [Salpingoeca rosetta]|uniref:Reverse transcriptase Ty1/copia-type domain-containing protein n=1 Tax=Salpingoeca rosetta (strain ATCC 50818 / BSB-021) TaxID=946362 RepID=F2UAA4_SALR5|nr:uncharacterized protein PTSG_12309 [Salpingoeca rosetta]EGD73679.1 hypothetical protein PTSG_12309 [Salpingoeca rosetta]|eukprot:XP_004993960.1 hypothetical protein PTSG_12309 [Salpingoeca rosetta]